MKKALFICCVLFVLFIFAGCNDKTYEFRNSVDEIKCIEIVSAESSLEYTVIKTLSKTEKDDFIEELRSLQFGRYIAGDPMSVYGDAVKITYQDGDYEMICYYWAEYVKNGEIYPVQRSCDEKEFTELLSGYLD